jgi:transposase
MNAYSEDLREKIIDALRRGMGKSEAARTFSVSLSSVKRYAKLAEEGRSLAPKKRSGSKPKIDERSQKLLEVDLKERPFITLQKRCEYLRTIAGSQSIHRVPSHKADELDQEKGGRSATEREEFLRAAWRVMVAGIVDPTKLVFVDECGTHTSLAPVYGYSPKGERLKLSVARNRGL